MHRLALSLAAFSLLVSPALAQGADEEENYARIESIHGDAEGFMTAADRLGDAMSAGDAETIAALAEYPLVVEANGETYDVLAAEDLVSNFDRLVSAELRAEVGSFTLGELIVTSDGVGFADGGLWMTNFCLDDACSQSRWAIIRINDTSEAGERRGTLPAEAEFPLAAGSWGGKVRSGPGQDHAQIASLENGDRLTVLERTGEFYLDYPWFMIEMADGSTGYHWGGVICGLDEAIPGAFETCDR